MDDFLKTYYQEAQDLVEDVLDSLECMRDEERFTDPGLINEIMRKLHTLKGNSNMVGFTKIGTIVHKLEDVFVKARDSQIILSRDAIDFVIDTMNSISNALDTMYSTEATSDEEIELDFDPEKIMEILQGNFMLHESDVKNVWEVEKDGREKLFPSDDHAYVREENKRDKQEHSSTAGQHHEGDDGEDSDKRRIELAKKIISEKLKEEFIPKFSDSELKKFGTYAEQGKPMAYFFVKLSLEDDFDAEARMIMDKLKEKGFEVIITFTDIVDEDIIFHFFVSTFGGNVDISNLGEIIKDFKVIWRGSSKVELSVKPKSSSAPAAKSSMSASPPAQIRERKILKIETRNVEKILNIIGEMVIAKNAIQSSLEKIVEISKRPEVEQKVKDNISEIERKIRELQDIILEVRMLSIDEIIKRIKRDLEKTARVQGKKVIIKKEGENIDVDYEIANKVKDALIHIAKNAITHGIEEPEERIAVGKKETGEVIIKTTRKGGFIFIEITDDGRGIDPQKVVQKYLKLISSRNFDPEFFVGEKEEDFRNPDGSWNLDKVYQLLFLPGFSTKDVADQNAGRGAGLDEVKKNIEEIKGKITVKSSPGDGTKFTIKIPTSKVVLEVVIFSWKGEKYAIPLASVEKTEIFSGNSEISIKKIQGRRIVLSDGAEISLVTLDEIFGREPSPLPENFFILFIETGEDKFSRIGLVVEEILDIKDAVMKSFDEDILDIKGVSAVVEEIGEDGQKEIIPVVDVLKSNLI